MSIKKNDKIKMFGSEIEFKVFQIFVVLLILILFGPIIFISVLGLNDMNKTGGIGDTFNGLTAPFISLLSAILVFLAFRAQVIANKLVNDQFRLQLIETRFFELLKLHRDNVGEIGIGKSYGKKIFVTLIREFRLIHSKLDNINIEENIGLDNRKIMEVSYLILFFGFEPNSSRQLQVALEPYNINGLFELLVIKFDNRQTKLSAKNDRKFNYTPFEGHQSRLGHYFRHLYQTVDYIDRIDIEIDKYSYIKALRAQLTTHEQALLYINSLTPAGSKWWTKGFIEDYRLLKNIPPGFFNPVNEFFSESMFPDKYFEHQED